MTAILTRSLFLTSPMMRGGDVSAGQTVLRRLDASLAIDGMFGRETEAAGRAFQRHAGPRPVGGIVGPATWGRMFAPAGPAAAQAAPAPPVGNAARPCYVVLVGDRWGPAQACGILGN